MIHWPACAWPASMLTRFTASRRPIRGHCSRACEGSDAVSDHRPRCRRLILALALLCLAAWPAGAQDKPRLRAASLTLPVLNPIVVNILKQRSFDTKHGFELEPKPYPSIAAFYAALATGEVDTLIGGPVVLQKLRSEGVPVKIVAT